MVGSLVRFLFTSCEESQRLARSFVCDSSQLVNKNHSPTMKLSIFHTYEYYIYLSKPKGGASIKEKAPPSLYLVFP